MTKGAFVIGFGVGYVLGAKAGRQRYEEIRRWWGEFTGSPTVQRAAERTKAVAAGASKRGLEVVQTGVEKAGTAVKSRLHREDTSESMVDPLQAQMSASPGRKAGRANDALGGSTGSGYSR